MNLEGTVHETPIDYLSQIGSFIICVNDQNCQKKSALKKFSELNEYKIYSLPRQKATRMGGNILQIFLDRHEVATESSIAHSVEPKRWKME